MILRWLILQVPLAYGRTNELSTMLCCSIDSLSERVVWKYR